MPRRRAPEGPWLTTAEAGRHVGLAIGTLNNRRYAGSLDPPWHMTAMGPRYALDELDAWLIRQAPVVAPPLKVTKPKPKPRKRAAS